MSAAVGVSLEARAAIQDLNARFAWLLDLHQYDELRDVLASNVHYVSIGREFHDVEAVIGSFRARTGTRTTRHGLGNLLLTATSEDVVTGHGSWHTFASNEQPESGQAPRIGLYMVADFHDTYARGSDGAWRISERLIVPVFRDARLAPGA